jgi:hypothetical protein
MANVGELGDDPAVTGDQPFSKSRCHRGEDLGSWKRSVEIRP